MKHTKIYGALIIIAIALALFLLVFFGVNIKVNKSVLTQVGENNTVSIHLEGKQYQYVNEHINNYYYITDPIKDQKYKCYLEKASDNTFNCFLDSNRQTELEWDNIGWYPATFEFGSMKIFRYLIEL